MKALQNYAAIFFIIAVSVLSLVSIFGIWDIFSGDVVWKSFETLGLLAIVASVIIKAGAVMKNGDSDSLPNPLFVSIRKISLTTLIVSASLLALLGVLSIWDVITDKDALYKSLGTLAVIAFGAAIVKVVCDEMDDSSKKIPVKVKG